MVTRMRAGLTMWLALAVALLIVAAPAASAQGREQIIFSGEAEGSIGEVGFWVWCALDEAGAYDDCNGAMRFDDIGQTKHVDGEVSEPDEGEYVMEVSSSDGSVDCTLTNTPPVTQGQTNTVDVDCTAPSGSASTSSAVVIATQ
jgi:hypothetical protein